MTALPEGLELRIARSISEIPTETFYRIAALRQDVFAVEQQTVYLDLDGRDLEPGALQYWVQAPGGEIAATIRVLPEDAREPGLRSIGRVVTAPAWRGQGLAAALIAAALDALGDAPVEIHAQSHLERWYAGFGFERCGAEFLEDGLPHVPMRRG